VSEPKPRSTRIRPYGDTTDDGLVQVSFVLPVPAGPRAEAAAVALAAEMGIERASVVHSKAVGETFTFFVLYGAVRHSVDLARVEVDEREYPLLSPSAVNLAIRTTLRRKLTVVGACIGNDAHTVGIDAILSMKGFGGEKGLEAYREMRVVNLGAQVPPAEVVEAAAREGADAVLVSQVVSQRDAPLENLKALVEATAGAFPSDARPLLIAGGPRLATLRPMIPGLDRVFGRGTTPREVASYLAYAVAQRRDGAGKGARHA
jgi:beta-lysine 5,6-aminomutase beta subunit